MFCLDASGQLWSAPSQVNIIGDPQPQRVLDDDYCVELTRLATARETLSVTSRSLVLTLS
jgi:hypothetical protein